MKPLAPSSAALDLRGILERNLAGVEPTATQPVTTESWLALAPNAIEWCIGKDFCDSPTLFEFTKSYQTIRDYFELRCPICNQGGIEPGQPGDCWKRSRAYLEREVLLVFSKANLEDTCPKCRVTRSELIERNLFHGFNQLHLVCGMRAGKSITAGLIGTYVEHACYSIGHTYPDGLHGYFNCVKAVLFEITFLASNQLQSEATIWALYYGLRKNSPWFQRYVPWIKKQAEEQPNTGMRPWRYVENLDEIINEHPDIRVTLNALNSNSAGQAGRTRLHGFVDELDRMKQTPGSMGADEIYRTIEASLRTIRSRVKLYGGFPWMGSMFSVTSPITRAGKALALLQKATEIPDMYARHYKTWEFNPLEPFENFKSDYIKDPVGAERDFGANPPGAEYPLIHDERRWLAIAVNPKLTPKAAFRIYRRRAPTGQLYVGAKLTRADRLFDRRMPRFIVFDAGKNFDSFAGACAHGEPVEVDGKPRIKTVYDWVFRIVPEANTEIWFESVHDIMKDLKQFQYTAFVGFDHWNSVQLIQQIRDLGIPAEQETIKDSDFIDWKVNCFEGLVDMLPPAVIDLRLDATGVWTYPLVWNKSQPLVQPESNVIIELTELQCDPDTKKVSNPNKGEVRGQHSDDQARCVVHVHRCVQRAGFTERYDDRSVRAARKRAEYTGGKWGLTGGSIAHAPSIGVHSTGKGRRGW